jgi:inosine/xanthosine triphosphatase
MLIVIGSTRPAKVEGARAAIEAIGLVDVRFAQAIVDSQDVTDVAPRMPMSAEEIRLGARVRATTLLARRADARFAVGVEGGLDRVTIDGEPQYVLCTWACVADGRRWSYGAAGSVVVPDAIATAVLGGRELGEVVDTIAATDVRGTRGAWGVLTRDLISRQDAFRIAVISAFAPFYNPAAYGGT